MYNVKIFTEKKLGQKLIVCGPYVGSWTQTLMIHIPIVNRLREQNPDAYIVSGGQIGDSWYYKTPDGKMTIDAYVGYPPPEGVRRVFGLNQRKFEDDVYRFEAITEKYWGKRDAGFIQPGTDTEWVNGIVARFPRTMYRIGTFAPEPIDNEPYVVLHARPYKRFNPDTTPIPDAYSRDNPYWSVNAGLIERLSQHYRVYVAGIKGESYEFDVGGRVSALQDIPMEAKPAIMSSLVNNAECVISTMSSAVASFGLFVGCPVIQFDTKIYVPHLQKWNVFGTHSEYLEAGELNPQWRYEYVMKFIEEAKKHPRYTSDVLREDNNLTWRL